MLSDGIASGGQNEPALGVQVACAEDGFTGTSEDIRVCEAGDYSQQRLPCVDGRQDGVARRREGIDDRRKAPWANVQFHRGINHVGLSEPLPRVGRTPSSTGHAPNGYRWHLTNVANDYPEICDVPQGARPNELHPIDDEPRSESQRVGFFSLSQLSTNDPQHSVRDQGVGSGEKYEQPIGEAAPANGWQTVLSKHEGNSRNEKGAQEYQERDYIGLWQLAAFLVIFPLFHLVAYWLARICD